VAAYIVFVRERTRDSSELQAYASLAPGALQGHPVEVLALYGSHEVLEGPDVEGVAILRFPDAAAARAWYDSPAYREARAHRLRGADYRAVLVAGEAARSSDR